jgi:hypothetical protein
MVENKQTSVDDAENDVWNVEESELKDILKFDEEHDNTVVVTRPANMNTLRVFKMAGPFGDSLMAEFPEGLVNITSKRIRIAINLAKAGKISIHRSGTGYATKYTAARATPDEIKLAEIQQAQRVAEREGLSDVPEEENVPEETIVSPKKGKKGKKK